MLEDGYGIDRVEAGVGKLRHVRLEGFTDEADPRIALVELVELDGAVTATVVGVDHRHAIPELLQDVGDERLTRPDLADFRTRWNSRDDCA